MSPEITTSAFDASYKIADVTYTHPFYAFLAPAWLDYVAVLNGVTPPDRRGGFSWCDLGCGFGVTAVGLAATHGNGRFGGIDMNAGHIDDAQCLARDAAVENATFLATDIATADREAESFDYIVAHGVYTWVGPQTQAELCRFIDHHLKPGGLVYVSYNALPGCQRDLAFQRLLYAFADTAPGDSIERVKAALEGVREPLGAGVPTLKDSRSLAQIVESPGRYAPSYLVHEYLVGSWRPVWVTEVRAAMAAIGLSPVGSATIVENHDSFVLGRAARATLGRIEDEDIRELTRDFFISQEFRRDVFIRDRVPLDEEQRVRRLFGSSLALPYPSACVTFSAQTPAGRLTFENAAARAVVAALEGGPATLESIAQQSGHDREDLLDNTFALIAGGHVRPVEPIRAPVRAINRAILDRCGTANAINDLMLPCGTAVDVEDALLTALAADSVLDDEKFPGWRRFFAAHGL